jgi:hypothetical protein
MINAFYTNTTGDVECIKYISLKRCGSQYYRFKEMVDSIYLVTASGKELEECCKILGRSMPNRKFYKFSGDNATEIALNW